VSEFYSLILKDPKTRRLWYHNLY